MKLAPSLVAVLSLASAPTSLHAQPPARSPAPVRFELPNGLRVWVQEAHGRPVALVQVTYHVGSINEGPGTTGTAHYVEHMVYRATEGIRNEDIYGYIDRIGGRYTGGTEDSVTSYGETVPSWALEEALRVTAERMGRARFDVTEFERERNNVVTEANGFSASGAQDAFRDAVMAASFELHPYRYNSNSWARDNLSLSRDQAFDFYKRYYGPNNAVLAVVGDVSVDEVRRLVVRHFASLQGARQSGEVQLIEPPQRAEKRVAMTYAGERKQLEIVYRAPQASHRDYPVLVVLDRVLQSRIKRALGAVAGAELVTTQFATPYPFVYRMSVTAPGTADIDQLLALVQSEIERLGREALSPDELAGAKAEPVQQRRRGRGAGGGGQDSGVPPRQSSLTEIASQLSSREVFSWEIGPTLMDSTRAEQARVTSADLQRFVDRWLRTSQRTVGTLVPGPDNYVPVWTDARRLAGERMEVPPLTTPPAKRRRPQPVSPRALSPLSKLALATTRRTLPNGVVVRAARVSGATAALQLRVDVAQRDTATIARVAAAARLIAGDSALRAFSARASTASIANDGYFDVRLSFPSANLSSVLETLGRTITAPQLANGVERAAASAEPARTRRGAVVDAEARSRVLRIVDPLWRPTDPPTASPPTFSVEEVTQYLRGLTGGALTVSLAGPGEPAALAESVAAAFASVSAGPRVRATGASLAATARETSADVAEERVPLASETQVTVVAGLSGVPRSDPDRRALELLNYIIGVPSYGGRLGWALTKSGLTYSSAAATTFGESTGHILLSTKCDTRNLDATIQALREVVAGVAARGVEDWELREAQAFTLGRTLLYGAREDSAPDAVASALTDSETTGQELLDLPALSRGYLDVTLAQVNAAARRFYRPDQLKVVAIGAIPEAGSRSPFPAGTFRALFEPR
jgi:predicted Zn-dependent peptidase